MLLRFKIAFPVLCCMCWLAQSCTQEAPFFTTIAPAQSGIYFTNTVAYNDTFNVLHYPYLFNGAGVAVGDVDGDGRDDIFFVGNTRGSNKLYRNKGDFKFEDITAKAGVAGLSDWCTGAAMVDINADGRLDIYVSTVNIPGIFKSTNELFINQGFRSLSPAELEKGPGNEVFFKESASQFGLDKSGHTTQSSFFDYDRDGDLDCFLLNHAISYNDDYSTIAARQKKDSLSGSRLLRNDNGFFTDVTDAAGIISASNQFGLGIAVGDINGDQWPDLYVSNDFKEADFCYINNRNGSFTEQSQKLFAHTSRFSMGNDMADWNNDGWPDVVTLDMLSPDEAVLKSSLADDDIGTYNYKVQNFGFHYQFSKNCLQQNIGGQQFADVGLQAGVAATDWSWAPLLADFNNDGRKDLYISNGYRYRTNDLDFNAFAQNALLQDMERGIVTQKHDYLRLLPAGPVADFLFISNGESDFTDASAPAGFVQPTFSNGAAYSDLDNDGDLDLVVNRMNSAAGIYRNDFSKAAYLSVSLQGEGANRYGTGTMIYVYAQGAMQCVAQQPVRGFMSSVSPVLHLGFGNAEVIDSLIVCWPDGRGQKLQKVKTNQLINLYQKDAVKGFRLPQIASVMDARNADEAASSGIHFYHKEDDFDDLNIQPLQPHGLATQGPKLTVADVNGDGLEDFFVCGAKGQPGRLYLQQQGERFAFSDQPHIAQDSLHEDTDALFFDADGDSDKDLYVCSGGGELYGRQPLLNDRLYINDGKGIFIKSKNLPPLFENKSCVRAADFDRDGDLDLFVGGRANARMFGYLPSSVILKNEHGRFTEATASVSNGLSTAGMVTDAAWQDIDRDGWIDLIVAGEWMPITIFKNKKGFLEKTILPRSEGLWQSLVAADVDKDGDMDFIAGNWGSNSKLTASSQWPLKLYISDWDGNGETEPVLATAKGDRYFSFFGKTDLEKRLPYLRKRFLKYHDFAGKTIEEVFGAEALQKAKLLQAATLQTSLLRNNGGILELEPLPHFLQTSPVMSIAEAGDGSFWAGGNFYEVAPYEGRYDAMLPLRFSFIKNEAVLQACLPHSGQLRDMATINIGQKPCLLMAANNGPLLLFKQKKP